MSIQCGGQSLWKYIIVISLDVNTQKCRQRVNKICVPFWSSRVDLTITKGKEITAFNIWFFPLSPLHKWLFFSQNGIIFWAAKGLALSRYKNDSLADNSIKIGLQKSAQISVHKCVQKLAYKSTKIGMWATKWEERTSIRFQNATFSRTWLSSSEKSFCRPYNKFTFHDVWRWSSLWLSLNCLVHDNVWMNLWQLSVSLYLAGAIFVFRHIEAAWLLWLSSKLGQCHIFTQTTVQPRSYLFTQ